MNALEAHGDGPSLSQLGLRKIIEEFLEAEVSERLGATTSAGVTKARVIAMAIGGVG